MVVMKDSGVEGFFVVSNVLVVASNVASKSILYVSSDGVSLMEAQFPPSIILGESVFFYHLL